MRGRSCSVRWGDCKRLLQVLKRLPVLDDLLCKHMLKGDGGDGNIGSVLSPHKEGLIEPVKLRKKERISLLLLRDSAVRATSTTSPYTRMRRGRSTALLPVIVSKKLGVFVTEEHKLGRWP
jgi:hypothetical protein